MIMNAFESWVMSSKARRYFLSHVEAPILMNLGGPLSGLKILEVGCGPGYGTEILLNYFSAEKVLALDLDPKMVHKAQHRLNKYGPSKVQVIQGDISQFQHSDAPFDSIVDFAALHHIEDWKKSIANIYDLLKPGGSFYFEEVTKQWIQRWPYKQLFSHPETNRFDQQEILETLINSGFDLQNRIKSKGQGDFIFGVAKKVS